MKRINLFDTAINSYNFNTINTTLDIHIYNIYRFNSYEL